MANGNTVWMQQKRVPSAHPPGRICSGCRPSSDRQLRLTGEDLLTGKDLRRFSISECCDCKNHRRRLSPSFPAPSCLGQSYRAHFVIELLAFQGLVPRKKRHPWGRRRKEEAGRLEQNLENRTDKLENVRPPSCAALNRRQSPLSTVRSIKCPYRASVPKSSRNSSSTALSGRSRTSCAQAGSNCETKT